MSEKGTLYFFTGLSGAGKTTLGSLFYRRLRARNPLVTLFDGDQIRTMFTSSGYSMEDRLRVARHIFPLYQVLTDQGISVVCCSIAMFDEIRDWNRAHIENYREIYIKVNMETLYHRDQKGLYSSGAKQVVGVDLPFDEPKRPDLIIENNGEETPEEVVRRIEAALFPGVSLPEI